MTRHGFNLSVEGASLTLLLLILALVLRLGVSFRPLWYDEAWTYWQASESSLADKDLSFGPLPTLIATPLVGRWDEPWMLRLPFIALGLASIALFRAAVRELDGNRSAAATALLLAVSPFHVYYSAEMRMYAIGMLAAAASTVSRRPQ